MPPSGGSTSRRSGRPLSAAVTVAGGALRGEELAGAEDVGSSDIGEEELRLLPAAVVAMVAILGAERKEVLTYLALVSLLLSSSPARWGEAKEGDGGRKGNGGGSSSLPLPVRLG
ncbi:Os04g0294401 [Oryza sativa Japonica Group]|uniref:Os04g0294401 protein n=1 Tax=Oryza sativa subsp. japonica TaxID=39947 RepID=A0A0P0W912_ORYSJ|nr:hypothetical protein DAI22_04g066666 [Oryza sativa Japonica Group]BAS88436.1 Os04g0294401 [Oryza sativa Japonica Group]